SAFVLNCSGSSQCNLRWPSRDNDAIAQRHDVDFAFSCPFRESPRFTESRDESVASIIAHLLSLSSPSHVASFVMSIILTPIDRVVRRGTTSNVIKKLFKSLESAFNTSSPISMVDIGFRVSATLAQALKSSVFRMAKRSATHTVRDSSTWLLGFNA